MGGWVDNHLFLQRQEQFIPMIFPQQTISSGLINKSRTNQDCKNLLHALDRRIRLGGPKLREEPSRGNILKNKFKSPGAGGSRGEPLREASGSVHK